MSCSARVESACCTLGTDLSPGALRPPSTDLQKKKKKIIFLYSKRIETNGVSGQDTQTHVWTYEKEVMGEVFHNLYLSSRNIPVVIIMDDEIENEDNEMRIQNIIGKRKEKRLLARRNKYGE